MKGDEVMRKTKLLAVLLMFGMALTVFAGCASGISAPTTEEPTTKEPEPPTPPEPGPDTNVTIEICGGHLVSSNDSAIFFPEKGTMTISGSMCSGPP